MIIIVELYFANNEISVLNLITFNQKIYISHIRHITIFFCYAYYQGFKYKNKSHYVQSIYPV